MEPSKQKIDFQKNFNCQLTFEIQWDPTPKVLEIVATVLYYIQEVKSQPTHDDNFSHECKKEGKVGLSI